MSSGRSRSLRTNPAVRVPLYLTTKIAPTSAFHQAIAFVQTRFNAEEGAEYWANLCSYYPLARQVFPKDWFGAGRRVSFEGLSLVVPDRAEDMLAQIYGPDYMAIPVPGDGHGKHNFYVRPTSSPTSEQSAR